MFNKTKNKKKLFFWFFMSWVLFVSSQDYSQLSELFKFDEQDKKKIAADLSNRIVDSLGDSKPAPNYKSIEQFSSHFNDSIKHLEQIREFNYEQDKDKNKDKNNNELKNINSLLANQKLEELVKNERQLNNIEALITKSSIINAENLMKNLVYGDLSVEIVQANTEDEIVSVLNKTLQYKDQLLKILANPYLLSTEKASWVELYQQFLADKLAKKLLQLGLFEKHKTKFLDLFLARNDIVVFENVPYKSIRDKESLEEVALNTREIEESPYTAFDKFFQKRAGWLYLDNNFPIDSATKYSISQPYSTKKKWHYDLRTKEPAFIEYYDKYLTDTFEQDAKEKSLDVKAFVKRIVKHNSKLQKDKSIHNPATKIIQNHDLLKTQKAQLQNKINELITQSKNSEDSKVDEANKSSGKIPLPAKYKIYNLIADYQSKLLIPLLKSTHKQWDLDKSQSSQLSKIFAEMIDLKLPSSIMPENIVEQRVMAEVFPRAIENAGKKSDKEANQSKIGLPTNEENPSTKQILGMVFDEIESSDEDINAQEFLANFFEQNSAASLAKDLEDHSSSILAASLDSEQNLAFDLRTGVDSSEGLASLKPTAGTMAMMLAQTAQDIDSDSLPRLLKEMIPMMLSSQIKLYKTLAGDNSAITIPQSCIENNQFYQNFDYSAKLPSDEFKQNQQVLINQVLSTYNLDTEKKRVNKLNSLVHTINEESNDEDKAPFSDALSDPNLASLAKNIYKKGHTTNDLLLPFERHNIGNFSGKIFSVDSNKQSLNAQLGSKGSDGYLSRFNNFHETKALLNDYVYRDLVFQEKIQEEDNNGFVVDKLIPGTKGFVEWLKEFKFSRKARFLRNVQKEDSEEKEVLIPGQYKKPELPHQIWTERKEFDKWAANHFNFSEEGVVKEKNVSIVESLIAAKQDKGSPVAESIKDFIPQWLFEKLNFTSANFDLNTTLGDVQKEIYKQLPTHIKEKLSKSTITLPKLNPLQEDYYFYPVLKTYKDFFNDLQSKLKNNQPIDFQYLPLLNNCFGIKIAKDLATGVQSNHINCPEECINYLSSAIDNINENDIKNMLSTPNNASSKAKKEIFDKIGALHDLAGERSLLDKNFIRNGTDKPEKNILSRLTISGDKFFKRFGLVHPWMLSQVSMLWRKQEIQDKLNWAIKDPKRVEKLITNFKHLIAGDNFVKTPKNLKLALEMYQEVLDEKGNHLFLEYGYMSLAAQKLQIDFNEQGANDLAIPNIYHGNDILTEKSKQNIFSQFLNSTPEHISSLNSQLKFVDNQLVPNSQFNINVNNLDLIKNPKSASSVLQAVRNSGGSINKSHENEFNNEIDSINKAFPLISELINSDKLSEVLNTPDTNQTRQLLLKELVSLAGQEEGIEDEFFHLISLTNSDVYDYLKEVIADFKTKDFANSEQLNGQFNKLSADIAQKLNLHDIADSSFKTVAYKANFIELDKKRAISKFNIKSSAANEVEKLEAIYEKLCQLDPNNHEESIQLFLTTLKNHDQMLSLFGKNNSLKDIIKMFEEEVVSPKIKNRDKLAMGFAGVMVASILACNVLGPACALAVGASAATTLVDGYIVAENLSERQKLAQLNQQYTHLGISANLSSKDQVLEKYDEMYANFGGRNLELALTSLFVPVGVRETARGSQAIAKSGLFGLMRNNHKARKLYKQSIESGLSAKSGVDSIKKSNLRAFHQGMYSSMYDSSFKNDPRYSFYFEVMDYLFNPHLKKFTTNPELKSKIINALNDPEQFAKLVKTQKKYYMNEYVMKTLLRHYKPPGGKVGDQLDQLLGTLTGLKQSYLRFWQRWGPVRAFRRKPIHESIKKIDDLMMGLSQAKKQFKDGDDLVEYLFSSNDKLGEQLLDLVSSLPYTRGQTFATPLNLFTHRLDSSLAPAHHLKKLMSKMNDEFISMERAFIAANQGVDLGRAENIIFSQSPSSIVLLSRVVLELTNGIKNIGKNNFYGDTSVLTKQRELIYQKLVAYLKSKKLNVTEAQISNYFVQLSKVVDDSLQGSGVIAKVSGGLNVQIHEQLSKIDSGSVAKVLDLDTKNTILAKELSEAVIRNIGASGSRIDPSPETQEKMVQVLLGTLLQAKRVTNNGIVY